MYNEGWKDGPTFKEITGQDWLTKLEYSWFRLDRQTYCTFSRSAISQKARWNLHKVRSSISHLPLPGLTSFILLSLCHILLALVDMTCRGFEKDIFFTGSWEKALWLSYHTTWRRSITLPLPNTLPCEKYKSTLPNFGSIFGSLQVKLAVCNEHNLLTAARTAERTLRREELPRDNQLETLSSDADRLNQSYTFGLKDWIVIVSVSNERSLFSYFKVSLFPKTNHSQAVNQFQKKKKYNRFVN